MNIVRENLEDGTTLLKATVAEADYNEAVDKALRTYKRKANVPGFRPGMVPMSIINKMYRKGVVAEEAYRAASNGCFDYIEKEKLTLVGDMIPSEKQQPLDFENSTEYEFAFEVGLAPEINIPLSKKDKVKKYTIAIEDKMREGYRSNFTRRFGKLVDVDTVEKEDALNVTLDQSEMKIEEAYVGLIGMSDAARKPFLGKKVGDTMEVDVNELYPTPAQRAAILQVKEDELEGINPKFTLTITKIRRDLSRESDFLFTLDIRRMLLDKANLALPDAFLKRWLFTINEGKFSLEEIEKDFDKFLEMMKWNLIQKHYVNELKLEVTPEEATQEAKALAMQQFAYYGMNQVADDMLANYAKSILENKEESRKVYEKLFERKVIDAVVPQITVTDTTVTPEEFAKLAEKAQ